MKKTLLLSTIFCILLQIGCKQLKDDKNIEKIMLNDQNPLELTDVSALINDVTIIPLTEKKENLIGSIFKLFQVKDKYVAFDYLHTHKINLYDKTGNIIKTIIKTGGGLNEAFQINDCWINNSGELEVYDYAQKKVYQFDSLFNLKKIVKSKQFYIFYNIASLPSSDQYIGYTPFSESGNSKNGKLFHLGYLNKEFDIVKQDLEYDKKFRGIIWLTFKDQFHRFNDTLRFAQTYDNYIYNITSLGAKKRFKLVYMDPISDDILETVVAKKLTVFKDYKIKPVEKAKLLEGSRFFGIWHEAEKYVYLVSKDNNGKGFISLYNKKTKKVEFDARELVESKKYKLKLPMFEFYNAEENSMMSIVTGSDLIKSLLPESPLRSSIEDDPTKFYIVKAKIK